MSVVGEGTDDEGPEGGDREEPGRALEPAVVGRELEGAGLGVPNGEEQAEGKTLFSLPVRWMLEGTININQRCPRVGSNLAGQVGSGRVRVTQPDP